MTAASSATIAVLVGTLAATAARAADMTDAQVRALLDAAGVAQ